MPWLLAFLSSFVVFAQTANPPEEDYRFQLDQYRRYYAEYQIFKGDYEENSTLDNEQKTVLSARSALVARELTQASFVRILQQSINQSQTQSLAITIINGQLNELLDFYFSQADLARGIETKNQLSAFTGTYVSQVDENQTIWDRVQMINKVAKLLEFQREADRAFAAVVPQLADKQSLPLVKSGLDEVGDLQLAINRNIESLTQFALDLEVRASRGNQDLKKASQSLSEIKAQQIRMIDRIIDLDTNYVER